jgi:hypothetical protein
MASIPLSASSVEALKKEVRRIYDERKSSHLSESLAAALGFNTHAALLAELNKQATDPLYCLLDEEKFDARMQALGYPADPWFSFEDAKTPDMISTTCSHAYEIEYRSLRERAWRNVIVCAVNDGLRRRLFSLRAGDNRWPGHDPDRRGKSYLFDFTLPCDLPARASVHDAGFDELSIHVAVNPKDDWVKASNAGFNAGDLFASTWLEREKGAWIQTSLSGFSCRKHLLNLMADMNVSPLGYGDRGRVIM